ncbi:MAG: type II secretion system F family protein [ANME-2 cluster archaeon]|nr:type II secretion system F family protein [ANME-2 cluster archaeon]
MNIIDGAAYRIFNLIIRTHMENYSRLQTKIRQAHIQIPVVQYASRMHFISLFAATFAVLLGFWMVHDTLNSISIPGKIYTIGHFFHLTNNTIVDVFAIAAALLLFIIVQKIVYFTYILIPTLKSSIRQSSIDQSIPHAIIYLYALSRGGMNMLEIFRSLSTYSHIYGATAREFNYIIRDIEYFGHDLLTAIRNASTRTASEKLRDFFDGLVSVTSSGGNITAYLKSKSEQYHYVAVREQKIFLETLGVLAEIYISIFVAGPLFLITILVILGLIGPAAINILIVLIYMVIPVSTVIYLLILSFLSGPSEKPQKTYIVEKELNVFKDAPVRLALEEEHKHIEWIQFYGKVYRFTDIITHPLRTMRDNAGYTFFFSVPLGLMYIVYVASIKGIRINAVQFEYIDVAKINAIDDHVILAFFIVLVPYIVFYELHARRIMQIEDMMPEFLKRLASINEAGILLADAIAMVAESKIGVLRDEIKRVAMDISWGSSTAMALSKLEYRIRTDIITRIITLIIKASESTSDIRSILTIAATNADVEKQLKKARSTEMSIYVFIVYIAFFVFLFIVYVLSAFFLPTIPSPDTISQFQMISDFDLEEYIMLFFHAAMIQGLCSGLIAGQMGNGNVYSGIKHSVIMMSVAYVVFTILI